MTDVSTPVVFARGADSWGLNSQTGIGGLMSSNIAPMLVVDLEGHILAANRNVLDMLGYNADDLQHGELGYKDITAEGDRAADDQRTADPMPAGSVRPSERVYIARDGSLIPVKVGGTRLSNHPTAVVYLIEDLRDRRRTEAELRQRAREQEAVAELGRRVLQHQELPDLMHDAVHMVTELLGCDYAAVFEFVPPGDGLRLRAGAGWTVDSPGETVVGVDALGGCSLVADSWAVTGSAELGRRLQALGLLPHAVPLSGINVLIQGEDRPYGVLSAFAVATSPVSYTNTHFLQVIGNVLAGAVAHRRAEQIRADLLRAEHEARERAEAIQNRAAFLAEASNVLSSSLDYAATLASVARLAVPQIGDWCGVHVIEEDGEIRQVAAAHVDPDKVRLAHELREHFPFDPEAPNGLPRVLRTGESEFVPEITDAMVVKAIPGDPQLRKLILDLGLRSSMIVALKARGRILGAIQFVRAESGNLYGASDLVLAEDLAARAALAVDNARLYQEAQRVAATQSAILGQMADCVAIADPEGHIIYLNDAAQRLSGGDDRGKRVQEYIEPYAILTEDGRPFPPDELPLARALAGDTVIDCIWKLRHRNGKVSVAQGSASPVLSSEGVLLGAVLTYRDITASFELERQKDDFLSAAAHDLKTPLTAIKGLAQLLERRARRLSDTDAQAFLQSLQRIDVTATRMTGLINELLDVTRVRMDRPFDLDRRPTDLVAAAHHTVAEYAHTADKHRIQLETTVSELVGIWDATRLERVLANLISNAVKYSPEGGKISVVLSEERVDDVAWAVLSVTDSGIGIPENERERIFDRFHRGTNVHQQISGTGIGLTAVRQIVEQHGGTVQVESEEGVGSTFTVRLPIEIPVSTVAGEVPLL